MIENSYIFPHGTRFADSPLNTTPASKRIVASSINADPSRPTRSVLEKSNFVFLTDNAGVFTDHATSIEWARNASA